MISILHTPSGVRLRSIAIRPGLLNWLFLPGGPGLGAESLAELVAAVEVPGTSWLVDLPGDGSNIDPAVVGVNPYARWPNVLIEAAQAVENPVYIGHSTGGMYLLSVPELEPFLRGIALVDSVPDASWIPEFVAMTEANPLPAVTTAAAAYEADKSDARLADLAVASAQWNFTSVGLATGQALLARLPYNRAAVTWSDVNFDNSYVSTWWPHAVPTLIVSGAQDQIVAQTAWNDPRFAGANVIRYAIPGGGHFPWIERPEAVKEAFAHLTAAILTGNT